MSNKVLRHPLKEEIIKRLLSGESVKEVEKWLKKKHPKSKRLQISYMTLQKFRKEHLHLEGEVLDNIKQARSDKDMDTKALEAKAIIANSSAYQEKINEIASNELDANRKLIELMTLIASRLEYYFNLLNTGAGGNIKQDKLFIELINTQRALVQDYFKYIEGVADKKIEHNINVNIINEQVSVLKNIVYDVLQEMEPELIPVFVEKVNQKINGLNYGTDQYKEYRQLEVIDAETEEAW